MKYRHYAPTAPMTVYVGTVGHVRQAMQKAYDELTKEGKIVGFLVSREVSESFPKDRMYIFGSYNDKPSLASQLYTGLLFSTAFTSIISWLKAPMKKDWAWLL